MTSAPYHCWSSGHSNRIDLPINEPFACGMYWLDLSNQLDKFITKKNPQTFRAPIARAPRLIMSITFRTTTCTCRAKSPCTVLVAASYRLLEIVQNSFWKHVGLDARIHGDWSSCGWYVMIMLVTCNNEFHSYVFAFDLKAFERAWAGNSLPSICMQAICPRFVLLLVCVSTKVDATIWPNIEPAAIMCSTLKLYLPFLC